MSDDSDHITDGLDATFTQKRPLSSNFELLFPSVALPQATPFRWLFLVGALFLPFAVLASFIVVTREWIVINAVWDYFGMLVSIAAGLFCLWQLPVLRIDRLLISVFYVPVVGFMSILFYFWFMMVWYGAHL